MKRIIRLTESDIAKIVKKKIDALKPVVDDITDKYGDRRFKQIEGGQFKPSKKFKKQIQSMLKPGIKESSNEYLAKLNIADEPSHDFESDDYNKQLVQNSLNLLRFRQADIIKQYYGIGCESKSVAELAEVYGVSTSRIQQLIHDGITKLKRHATIGDDAKVSLKKDYLLLWSFRNIQPNIKDSLGDQFDESERQAFLYYLNNGNYDEYLKPINEKAKTYAKYKERELYYDYNNEGQSIEFFDFIDQVLECTNNKLMKESIIHRTIKHYINECSYRNKRFNY